LCTISGKRRAHCTLSGDGHEGCGKGPCAPSAASSAPIATSQAA
jgi:hypothetical protein